MFFVHMTLYVYINVSDLQQFEPGCSYGSDVPDDYWGQMQLKKRFWNIDRGIRYLKVLLIIVRSPAPNIMS